VTADSSTGDNVIMEERSSRGARVTVVVSTLDRPRVLARCLEALRTGTRLPAAVVVVDQGQRSSAREVVDAACRRGLPVQWVPQDRRGLSASQNLGVRTAETDVVAIVDDDCVPDGRWVEVVDAAFSTAAGPLLLTGRVLPLPPEGQRVIALASRASTQRKEWTTAPMPWHVGTGGNFAITRERFLAVGGNDVRLGTGTAGRGANDLDLFRRLIASGVPARYEPDLLVLHERATATEYRSRLSTYGFGVGAMLGLWFRNRDRHAVVVLAGWLLLRWRVARANGLPGSAGEELKVLAGTVGGLVYGLSQTKPRTFGG
jgi:GT2 family glycosyltransferase